MKTVRNFMWYMYNKWCYDESVHVFGEILGKHIFDKWVWYIENMQDYTLRFFAELDEDCKTKIVERANEIYGE